MSNTKKASEKKPLHIDDIAAQITPVERTVEICVDGELVARQQQLERELETAQDADLADERLGAKARAPKVAQQIVDLQKRMRQHTYTFRFRAKDPKTWSDLLAKHADSDGKRLFNVDTFPPAAIAEYCVEPAGMDDLEAVKSFLSKVSAAQQSDLFDAAWDVNTQAPKETFSANAFAVLQSSEMSSSTASRLGSPGPYSSGG